MNSPRGMNRHYSAKLCNERTTADSLEANRFFEYEAQVPRIKLSDDFDLPTIKRWDDMWSDCDESCRNFEFATGTSFFSQNYTLI